MARTKAWRSYVPLAVLAVVLLLLPGCLKPWSAELGGGVGKARLILEIVDKVDVARDGSAGLTRLLSSASPDLTGLLESFLAGYDAEPSARSSFEDSIEKEFALAFGAQAQGIVVSPLGVVGSARGTGYSLRASSHLFAASDENGIWRVVLGPQSETDCEAAWTQFLTEMMFRALHMQSIPGQQVYEQLHMTRIQIPAGLTLYGTPQLEGLSQNLDLGGGSSLATTVRCDGTAVIVTERLIQVEQEEKGAILGRSAVDVPTLAARFLEQKRLEICYGQASVAASPEAIVIVPVPVPPFIVPIIIPDSFSYDGTAGFSLDIPITIPTPEGSSLVVTLGGSASVRYELQWKFSSQNSRLLYLKSVITPGLRLTAKVDASLLAGLGYTLEKFDTAFRNDVVFFAGPVPVWLTITLDVGGECTVTCGSTVEFTAGPFGERVTGAFGFTYDARPSTPVADPVCSIKHSKVEGVVTLKVGRPELTVTVRPAAEFQICLYDLAGPYGNLGPKLELKVGPNGNCLDWALGLSVTCDFGLKASSWLNDIFEFGLPEIGPYTLETEPLPLGGGKFLCRPTPPTRVQASDGTYTDKVRVTWTASSGATSYEVWRSTSNSTSSATKIGSPTGTTYDDTGATGTTTYYYWVRATNANGISDFSTVDPGRVKTSTPVPPTNVQASDGTYTDKVRVTWTASSGATSYEVWRSTSNSTSSATKIGSPTGTTYDDTGATGTTTYYYWVKATNAGGTSGFSTGDSGRRGAVAAPSPPTGVQASDGTYTDKVRVTWTASSGATSYEVWRSTSTGIAATKIGSTTGTTYDDKSGTAGKTYYYWVKAVNSAGASGLGTVNSGWRKAA